MSYCEYAYTVRLPNAVHKYIITYMKYQKCKQCTQSFRAYNTYTIVPT